LNNANEKPIVGLRERVYEPTKLAALFDILVDQGCPPREILKNVSLTADEVHSPKSRISLADLMTAGKNAIRLSNDPHLPYRIGTSIHISAYGMYGFAILCSPDFRKTMAFAELYHALAAPLATIKFAEQDGLHGKRVSHNDADDDGGRASGRSACHRIVLSAGFWCLGRAFDLGVGSWHNAGSYRGLAGVAGTVRGLHDHQARDV
jgi:Arabinose-binding domain of AraC transcription regulator, N-term